MVGDLDYGRCLYDWWSRHRLLYRIAIAVTFLRQLPRLRRRAVGLGELELHTRVFGAAYVAVATR